MKDIMAKVWSYTETQQFDKLEAYFTPATEFRMPGATLRGLGEFRALCEAWWAAFPDLRHEVVTELVAGDLYACEMFMTGTHTATWHTPKGAIPATGKTVRMATADFVRIREGRIVTWHAYPDMVGLFAQLGIGG